MFYSRPFLTPDASGVLEARVLEFLANMNPSAQVKLGGRRLDEARDVARAMTDPSDLEIARRKLLHAAEISHELESKSGLSKFLQAREYRKSAKEALRFARTVSDRAVDGQLNPTAGKIDVRLCAEMKPKVTTLVEHLYHFKPSNAPESISFNAERAQMLLRDMNFIYPEARDSGNPYRHPIIQDAIDVTLFRNKDDVGVIHHEQFSPMPIPIIALILTVVQCCIDEWSNGSRQESSWDVGKTQAVYCSHVSSLYQFEAQGLEERNVNVLLQLQWDLLRSAREHAGVLPYSFPYDPLPSDPRRYPPLLSEPASFYQASFPHPPGSRPPHPPFPEPASFHQPSFPHPPDHRRSPPEPSSFHQLSFLHPSGSRQPPPLFPESSSHYRPSFRDIRLPSDLSPSNSEDGPSDNSGGFYASKPEDTGDFRIRGPSLPFFRRRRHTNKDSEIIN